MRNKSVASVIAALSLLLFVGTILHHDSLTHDSMVMAEAQCCAVSSSGIDILANGYNAFAYFAATLFALAVSLPTLSSKSIPLFRPPKL